MDKKHFIEALRSYTVHSPQDLQYIAALKKKYPFSQTLHVLSAKASKDHQSETQQRELQHAAVYSTDRAVLKEIMTMDLFVEAPAKHETAAPENLQHSNSHSAIDTPASAMIAVRQTPVIPKTVEEKLVVYKQIEHVIDHVDVADTVLRDLKKLSELKHNFEMLFAEHSSEAPVSRAVNTESDGPHAKTRREKIIEAAKNLGHDSSGPLLPTGRRKKKDPSSDIIEEIKTSKEEIEPGSERLKEQIEIIDQFIKTQPSISNVRDRNPLPPTDLNSIRSGEFGENIVSETLVEILIKQGKKDRAIEVLKKLIWKYPQKKAYFASQIEDLKK